jgi:hypothetical protein
MPIFYVARWLSTHGMAEWLCAQKRLNPEVIIIVGTAARYRWSTVGSSHGAFHPDNSTLRTGAVFPTPTFCTVVQNLARTLSSTNIISQLPSN